MGSTSQHKVCFPIDGQPAINRALNIYTECGIQQHIVVVGAMAGQVIETVGSELDNVFFVYQAEQIGTAHAARQGLKVLDGLESEQDVLLVAGDRIVKSTILEQLFDLYYSRNCDLALLAVPHRPSSNQGRIVVSDDGRLLGVVEAIDVRQRAVFRKLRSLALQGRIPRGNELLQIVKKDFVAEGQISDESKYEKAFGELWQHLAVEKRDLSSEKVLNLISDDMTRFEFVDETGKSIIKTPEEIENKPSLNTSVYLVRASALRYALKKLNRNNAQQEEYLSDMVLLLASAFENGRQQFRVGYLRVQDPTSVLSFNNPSELLEVEAIIQLKREKPRLAKVLSSGSYRKIADWINSFENLCKHGKTADAIIWNEFTALYSDEKGVIHERLKAYRETLKYTARVIGENEKVFLVRSPGRVNVMGRHIDHQGGTCNLMTIGYETLMVVRPRQDDLVRLYSVNPDRFPDRMFSIADMVVDLPWDDWLSLVNSEKVSRMVHTYGGDWAQYIKAAVLRLQKKFRTDKLCGMDLVVSGNIPIAAGLSSSSSLVVGAAEATVTLNQLDTFPAQLVDLCGEGEWFVGTRGGAADHAAVKFGQRGKVVKVTFFDFSILDIVPFPENYALAVCDSGLKAQKTGNARDLFNHRISCYRIGFLLIKKYFPQYTSVLQHLRDVNMQNLNVPLSWIYRILLHLPEKATRDELRESLPKENLDVYFSQHAPPEDGMYPIRGVVLFGLGEIERAKRYADAMKEGRMAFIGKLMNVSHDGDRVISIDENGNEHEYWAPTSNDYLLGLIDDLESGDLQRVSRAQLHWQPGSYHCSLPEIDRMVEISLRTPGVVGAQLAGAGLGGCMMVLARRADIPTLIDNLTEQYYKPHAKPPSVLVCRPVAGSDVLLRDLR
jgi:N-acetylgalactosamine kinase